MIGVYHLILMKMLWMLKTLENKDNIDIVEIAPLSYPRYFLENFKELFMQQDRLKIRLFV